MTNAAIANEIKPGQSLALLQELHILTRDGKLNQDSRRKLKQVYHLYQFIEKLLLDCVGSHANSTAGKPFTLADHGAGKSYLGFIIYDLFFNVASHANTMRQGHIYGIETRAELVQKSTALAVKLGFRNMSFLALSVAESIHDLALPAQIDIVTALHACDTATDDAIAFGLKKDAKYMVLVPCCQAEVSRALNANKAHSLVRTPLAELWRHPLHTREIGSQITNVLRCLYLEACGYEVTVTELVGFEHSMKNELIIAKKRSDTVGNSARLRQTAAQRMRELLAQLGLTSLLETRFMLPQQIQN